MNSGIIFLYKDHIPIEISIVIVGKQYYVAAIKRIG